MPSRGVLAKRDFAPFDERQQEIVHDLNSSFTAGRTDDLTDTRIPAVVNYDRLSKTHVQSAGVIYRPFHGIDQQLAIYKLRADRIPAVGNVKLIGCEDERRLTEIVGRAWLRSHF
jgi:hypothetical protein